MKNTEFTCDACEENFREKTDELIKNATAPDIGRTPKT